MPSSLRVLQIGKFYPPHRGGMETHLELLCSELRDCVDLTVLVSGDDGHEDVRIGGVRVIRLRSLANVASSPLPS